MSSPQIICRTSIHGRSGLPLFPRRQIRFMAKSELFRSPLWPILRFGGAFEVRRGEGDTKAIETAVRAREGG